MFKNILVATDGSDLAAKAVEQGILLAKAVGAKVTAVTVTEPFNVLSLAPGELGYTPIEYKKHAEAFAEEVLGNRLDCGHVSGCRLRDAQRRARTCLSSNKLMPPQRRGPI